MDAEADVLTTQCAEKRKVDAAQAAVASDQRTAAADAHRMTFAKVALPTGIGIVAGMLLGIWLESKKSK